MAATSTAVTAPAEIAVESPPVEAPAVSASGNYAGSSPPPAKKQETPKRRGPMMNLFKRDTGPQRATSVDDAIAGDVSFVVAFSW